MQVAFAMSKLAGRDNPVDDQTQVVTFMKRLNDSPIKRQLFRVYPETLEEAISLSTQGDFGLNQAKFILSVIVRQECTIQLRQWISQLHEQINEVITRLTNVHSDVISLVRTDTLRT